MVEAVNYAHERNKKIYVTANIYAHNEDFEGIEDYFLELEKIGVDALIISDPGIFSIARKVIPNMEIHISTQANNTNYQSALFWYNLGAKRIVVARELSLKEISEISKHIPKDFDIEAFVHGAMCMAYSGRCVLSNYMTGRDANRGECAHACRWKYHLMEEKRPGEYMPVFEDERGTYIYNSKDLCMIKYIPQMIDAGIHSFKIEGRMKTSYYVAAVVKAYREAIDDCLENIEKYNSKLDYYIEELSKSSHRNFSTGFYFNKPTNEDSVYTNNSYIRNYDFIALVESYDKNTGFANIEQRSKFVVGDEIEIFKSNGANVTQVVKEMYDEKGKLITEAPHPKQKIKIKLDTEVNKFDMLRKKA